MLVKAIMAPIRGCLLLARCFAFIYVCFSLGTADNLDWHIFPQEEVAFVLGRGRQVCLEALEENPGWVLFGHVLGNLRQT